MPSPEAFFQPFGTADGLTETSVARSHADNGLTKARVAKYPSDATLLTRIPPHFMASSLDTQEFTASTGPEGHRHICCTVCVSGVPQTLIGGESLLPDKDGNVRSVVENQYYSHPVLMISPGTEYIDGFKQDMNSGREDVDVTKQGTSVIAARDEGGHKKLGPLLAANSGNKQHYETLQAMRDAILAYVKTSEAQAMIVERGAIRHTEAYVRLTKNNIIGVGITLSETPEGIGHAVNQLSILTTELARNLSVFVYDEYEGSIWYINRVALEELNELARSSSHLSAPDLAIKLKKHLVEFLVRNDFDAAPNHALDHSAVPSSAEIQDFNQAVSAEHPNGLAKIQAQIHHCNTSGLDLTYQVQVKSNVGVWEKIQIYSSKTGQTYALVPAGCAEFQLLIIAPKRGLIEIENEATGGKEIYEVKAKEPKCIPVAVRIISNEDISSAKRVDLSLEEMLHEPIRLSIKQYNENEPMESRTHRNFPQYRSLSDSRSDGGVSQTVSFLPPMPEGDITDEILQAQLELGHVYFAGKVSFTWTHMFVQGASNLQKTYSDLLRLTLQAMLETCPERELGPPIKQIFMSDAALPKNTEIVFQMGDQKYTGEVTFTHGYNTNESNGQMMQGRMLVMQQLALYPDSATVVQLQDLLKSFEPKSCECDVCLHSVKNEDVAAKGIIKTKERANRPERTGEIDVCPDCYSSLMTNGRVSATDGRILARLTDDEYDRINNIRTLFLELKNNAVKERSGAGGSIERTDHHPEEMDVTHGALTP